MELGKLYVTKDRRLVIKTKKQEFFVESFCGGGYYSGILLRTQEEIDKAKKEREKRDSAITKKIEEVTGKKPKKSVKKMIFDFLKALKNYYLSYKYEILIK